ncbi:MAG: hypothetical protein L0338_19275 [Acidobacteria bacterium]|nr:hypothetical protein [Acidobacteriota bacterium]
MRAKAWFRVFIVLLCLSPCAWAQNPSPDAIIKAYLNGLATNNLEGLWKYYAGFNADVTGTTQNLPQSMWPEKIDALKQTWIKRITEDRNQGYLRDTSCWRLIRSGATIRVLETRPWVSRGGMDYRGPGRDLWRSFVEVRYSHEQQGTTPIVSLPWPQGGRRLASVTFTIHVERIQRTGAHQVYGGCALVTETVKTWPVPELAQDKAFDMAQAAMPRHFYPSIAFPGSRAVSPRDTGKVGALKALLPKHGLRTKNPNEDFRNWNTDRYEIPSEWGRFAVAKHGVAWKAGGIDTYSLSETATFSLISFERPSENGAIAKIRVEFPGCSPICQLVKEIRTAGLPGEVVFENYMGTDWHTSHDMTVWFEWDVERGWYAKSVR